MCVGGSDYYTAVAAVQLGMTWGGEEPYLSFPNFLAELNVSLVVMVASSHFSSHCHATAGDQRPSLWPIWPFFTEADFIIF